MHTELSNYKRHLLQAVGLLILGYVGFSVADLCSKLLQQHYSTYQVLMVSGLLGTIISFIWLLTRYGAKSFVPHNLKLHLVRGAVTCANAFCMVSALKYLPLADFYGITFLAPFMILLMSIFFLGEHVSWRRWLAVAIAFSGVLVLAGPQLNTFGIGFVFAFGGAILSATSVILMRFLGHGQPLPLYSIFSSVFILVTNFIAMMVTDSYTPFETEHLLIFAFHGPMATVGIICTAVGFGRAPEASVVAPFIYTQIAWGILFGFVFFGVLPITTTYIGLAMIIGAGCYSIYRDYKRAHDKHKIIPDIT
jgi:drug/metabolite transporter (DMT)-like permease